MYIENTVIQTRQFYYLGMISTTVTGVKALIKSVMTKVFKIVLWIVVSILFFAIAFAVLSVLVFFLLFLIGAYPMDYTDSEAAQVFFLILIQLVYFVVFIIEGAILGFFIGTYVQTKNAIMNLKFFRRVYKEVMKRLYEVMKKKGYIATDDFDKHRGKERVSYNHASSQMNILIQDVISEESGGVSGLFSSPTRWFGLRAGFIVLKQLGTFILQRMSVKDKTGDPVVFLDVLDMAVKKGMWGFVKKFLITPLFLFTLASTGVFILIILLPIGICFLLTLIF